MLFFEEELHGASIHSSYFYRPMSTKRFRSLRSRLRALVWVIVLTLFFLETILIAFWFRNRYRREVANRVEIAQAIGLTFRTFVRDVLHQEVAMGAAIQAFSPESDKAVQDYLRTIAERYEAVRLFLLADSTGRIFAGSNPESIGKMVVSRLYFKRLLEGQEEVISDLVRTRSENVPGFVVGKGFYTREGRLDFAILAAVEAIKLGAALDLPKEPGDFFTIFDSQGLLVYTDQPISHLTDSTRNWRDSDRLLRKALAGEIATGFFTAPTEHYSQRVGARVPIGFGWVAGDTMHRRTFLVPILTTLGSVLLLSLAVAAAALVFGRSTIRSITRSLYGVQRHLRMVARGEYVTVQGDSGLEEFDNLTADTNQMALRLEEREKRLRRSEERFRTLADNMSQLAWMADPHGWIFWYNKRWYEYTGTTLEEMQGWGWKKVHHPDHVERVVTRIQHSWDTGEFWEDTFPLRSKEGEYRWFLSRAVPIRNDKGDIVRWFGTNTDITQRREVEQALKIRTEELGVANRELESFSYSVSHDLRGPLNRIGSFAAIIMEDYREKLDSEGKDYLQRIENGVEKMGHLIDNMLSLSRVSRQEMEFAQVDLGEKATGYFRELQETNPEREVELVIQDHIQARVDPGLFSLALENLLRNAWKFTLKTPHARIEFGTREQEGERVFFVRDNGAGFDMQYAEKMFTPFQRLHSEKEFSGTGVGLSIVQRIVQRHGGKLWAEGEVGKGAAFYFTIGVRE